MKKTICLNMIVKNESAVIRRCLETVKPLIDYWVISDTGSTDGTQKIIQEFMREIPGELIERPWVSFAHNRNEVLAIARKKADYVMIIDADDRLLFSENFFLPDLTEDAYVIAQRKVFDQTYTDLYIYFLISSHIDFEWRGVLHECLEAPRKVHIHILENVLNEYVNDGARSKDPEKIPKDIALLERGMQEEPTNSRYPYYLARTYWYIHDYENAMHYFQKCADMQSCPMEVYFCRLYIGLGQIRLNAKPEVFLKTLSEAYLYRPSRAESLLEIARYLYNNKNYLIAYLVAKTGLSIPLSTDYLFVDSWVYDWGMLLYFFLAAGRAGFVQEAYAALQELRKKTTLPEATRAEIQIDNWEIYLKQMLSQNNLQSDKLLLC